MLVLDAVGEVDAVWQRADLRLDDMRGRGRTVWHVPFILPVQKRRLFLRARQKNTEVLVGPDTERIAREIRDDGGDILIARVFRVDRACCGGRVAVGKELQRADAVADNGGEQAVGIRAVRVRELS